MKNILIPTDFSQNAWNAIEYACRFFSKSACNFYLLHVNTSDTLVEAKESNLIADDIEAGVLVEPSKKRLQQMLTQIVKSCPQNANHRFFTIIDDNYIIDSIRKQVEEKKIDFIVMGTKGASSFKKSIVGSNAGNVITKVKCTTMIVPENAKYTKLKEIAFPTDFLFFYLTETLQPITDIIKIDNAAMRVLYIDKHGGKLNEDQSANKEFLDDYLNGVEHSFHFLTNKHIEVGMQEFIESKEVNLITMLAKNLNYFQKFLFHPKVPGIGYYTDVPFLVLH